MKIFNQDMKHYKAQDGEEATYLTKTIIILICTAVLAAWGYTSNQQYEECFAGNQSVVLCGGGNHK